jgi:three-Cys-motif partner protein
LTLMSAELKIDEVGYWSEVKLAILAKYARLYNQILQSNRLHSVYIDGFAGAGHHKAKGSGRIIEGSPTRALSVKPAFGEYYFIDMNPARVGALAGLAEGKKNVHVYEGDCNEVLIRDVFPRVRWKNYQRALCILDPYGLHLDWQVIKKASDSRSIEIFLNFPVMDMQMNVFWSNPDRVTEENRGRMTRFWGDGSWHEAAYTPIQGLFGEMTEKNSIDAITKAFQNRLHHAAGFEYVPDPIPMRNTKGAVVYYLFFAAHNQTAHKIVKYIFERYAKYGEVPNG